MISLCALWSLTKYFLTNSVDILLSFIKNIFILIGILIASIIGAIIPVIPLIIILYIIDKHNDDNDKILNKKFLVQLSIIEIITFCILYWFAPITSLRDVQFYTVMMDLSCAIQMLSIYLLFPPIRSAYCDLKKKYNIFYEQCKNKS